MIARTAPIQPDRVDQKIMGDMHAPAQTRTSETTATTTLSFFVFGTGTEPSHSKTVLPEIDPFRFIYVPVVALPAQSGLCSRHIIGNVPNSLLQCAGSATTGA